MEQPLEIAIINKVKKDLPYYFSKLDVTFKEEIAAAEKLKKANVYSKKFNGQLDYGVFYKSIHRVI